MVFSSVPLYLDHHPNWQQLQQPSNQQGSGGENPQLQPPQQPLQVSGGGGGGGGGGSIRPGSMVDRARIAKLPLPEAGLKCPRCDSTHTKFCYFNNYNLSQPRHFCKTCRRYWTRGGALRNVPVGGGCRRNKRSSKSNSSKSQATNTAENQTGPKSTSASPSSHFSQPPPPFMAALQNLAPYGGGFQPHMVATGGGGGIGDMGFQIGSSSGGNSNILSNFLAGFDPNSSLYPYQNEGFEAPSSGNGHLAPGNAEVTRGLNLSTGVVENNQYWGGNTWTESNSMPLSFQNSHGKFP